MNRFAPTVLMGDGRTVTPEGWMWVLAFALRGVQWAIEVAETPAFRALVADRLRATKDAEVEAEVEAEIDELERRIADLRDSLKRS